MTVILGADGEAMAPSAMPEEGEKGEEPQELTAQQRYWLGKLSRKKVTVGEFVDERIRRDALHQGMVREMQSQRVTILALVRTLLESDILDEEAYHKAEEDEMEAFNAQLAEAQKQVREQAQQERDGMKETPNSPAAQESREAAPEGAEVKRLTEVPGQVEEESIDRARLDG